MATPDVPADAPKVGSSRFGPALDPPRSAANPAGSADEVSPADLVESLERGRMDATETAWALRDTARAAVEVDLALSQKMGMRPMDYAALGHVFTAGEGMGINALSARLGISTGSTSELVDRLETRGHLRRQRDTNDRRRVTLTPTDTAVAEVFSALGPLFDALTGLDHDYTDDQRAVIVDYLRRAGALMRKYAASD